MQLVRGLHNLAQVDSPSIVTIGAFDGIHRGHRAIISRVLSVAKQLGACPTVVLFEPQPSEFFAPDKAPARLSRFRDKVELLAELGIERLVCLRFDHRFAAMSAESFVREVLGRHLKTKHLIVGDDFRFGAKRLGDFAYLQTLAPELGFSVEDTPTTLDGGERISSTRIRQALAEGDCEAAERLLGRPFTISGRVGYGQQLGRTIGVPTANVALHRVVEPVGGVYAVRTHVNGEPFEGVANIGTKPTVGGIEKPQLEAHLFNFDGDIYGQFLRVELLKKLRDEQAFGSLDALKQQILQDQNQAKAFFAIHD